MNYAIRFTDYAKAELVEDNPAVEPGPDEIAAETQYSLISPGTEMAAGYLGNPPFPKETGYAAVSKVLQVGSQVVHIKSGDMVFSMGNHRSHQLCKAAEAFVLPAGLEPWKAVISRLMGVSMTTLMTTYARPGDRVLVMGAGPVGYLAAHIFAHAGYEVTVCDPDETRLQAVKASGRIRGYPSAAHLDAEQETFALVVECSGHESAMLDGLRKVRRRGEVVLIGVPWKRQTDLTAHAVAWEIFHKYAVLRSGWEWELPLYGNEHQPHSILTNLRTAANWIQEGRIPLDGLIRKVSPHDAQDTYQSLVNRKWKELFIVFDWTQLN